MKATNLNIYRVGQLVRLKMAVLGEPIGTVCYVYEAYMIGREAGVSLITQNGVDLGGFSTQEQAQFLIHVYDTDFYYTFRSVTWLAADFNQGFFDSVFAEQAIRDAQIIEF